MGPSRRQEQRQPCGVSPGMQILMGVLGSVFVLYGSSASTSRRVWWPVHADIHKKANFRLFFLKKPQPSERLRCCCICNLEISPPPRPPIAFYPRRYSSPRHFPPFLLFSRIRMFPADNAWTSFSPRAALCRPGAFSTVTAMGGPSLVCRPPTTAGGRLSYPEAASGFFGLFCACVVCARLRNPASPR